MSKDKVYAFFDILTKIGLGGVLFFIPISNALIGSFVGVVLLGFVGKKIVKPDFKWLKAEQNIFLALFFIFMGLSLINSGQYIDKSLVALFLKWGKFIILFLILQDSINKRKDLLIFVGIFLFSATLVALSGITQFFWGVEFLRGRGTSIMKEGVRVITSSFNHCNGLGAYLIIPLILCVSFLKSKSVFKTRLYYLVFILFIMFVFCAIFTYSRGTWIGVLAALVAMLFISRSLVVLSILAIILGLLFSVNIFRDIVFSMFQAGGDADRFKYWHVAEYMIMESPFLGRGLGTFMSYLPKYFPLTFAAYAHNCYLQILAESGIFSLISFLWFIYLVLYSGIKKFNLTKDPILLGGICGLVGFLAHSFFEVNFYSLPLAVLFWLWLGIVSVLGSGMIVDEK